MGGVVEKVDAKVNFTIGNRTTIEDIENFCLHARMRGAEGSTLVLHNGDRYGTELAVPVHADITGYPLLSAQVDKEKTPMSPQKKAQLIMIGALTVFFLLFFGIVGLIAAVV